MATTTNYGWTTPDDTALVKDGAAAIRTLGSSVDTTTKNLNPETTLGDIAFRSSSSNVNTRLGIGSTGQVLTVAGGVPTWAAVAGGGKVLQVVQATTTTATTITSNSFTDTSLSATITPSAATSKILVMWTQQVYYTRSSNQQGIGYNVVRTSTNIFTTTNDVGADQLIIGGSSSIERNAYISGSYLDSPSTTSATTYKTQARLQTSANSGSSTFQNSSNPSSMLLLEIGA